MEWNVRRVHDIGFTQHGTCEKWANSRSEIRLQAQETRFSASLAGYRNAIEELNIFNIDHNVENIRSRRVASYKTRLIRKWLTCTLSRMLRTCCSWCVVRICCMLLIGRHAVCRLGGGTTWGYTILLYPDRNHNCLRNLTPSCDSGDRSFPIVKKVLSIGTVE